MYGDVCMGVSSVRRWVKHFKDGNADVADQPRCGRQRTAATEHNTKNVDELIRQDRRITVREIAAQLAVGHHAIQKTMEILGYRKVCSHWVPRLLKGTEEHKMAGNCSPIHPTVRIWPLRLPLIQALESSPKRSPLRDWRGSRGSRVKLAARSWNGLLPQRQFYDSATLAEMHRSGWRFCRKVIKDAKILLFCLYTFVLL
jgi:plasmid stabilization system protein ParE